MKKVTNNRYLKCVLPLLLVALLVSAASAAPIGLDPGKWAPATYQRLAAFVEANGSGGPNYDPAFFTPSEILTRQARRRPLIVEEDYNFPAIARMPSTRLARWRGRRPL